MSVAALRKEWNACLNKYGSIGRCDKTQKELAGAAKSEGADACIDETIALMRCTTGSGKADGCSNQFLAMRECNRATGREIVQEGGAYTVVSTVAGRYTAGANTLTNSTPPQRTL